MELNETAVKHVAEVLKVDATELTTVLTTKDAKPEELISKDIKVFAPEEYNTLIDNVQKSGKKGADGKFIGGYDNGKLAGQEMVGKELKKQYNIEDEAIKKPQDIIDFLVNKAKADSGKPDDQKQKEWESEKKKLQDTILEKEQQYNDLKLQSESTVKNAQKRSEINSIVSGLAIDAPEKIITGQKAMLLEAAMQKYRIENEDGRTVIYDNASGEKLVDSLQNPLPLNKVITEFAAGYVSLKSPERGRGGDSSKNNNQSGDLASIKNKYDLEAYFKSKNISPLSMEASAIMKKVYEVNPDFKL